MSAVDTHLIQAILAVQESRETCALATVIHTWGHVPREVGAKMLVYRDGRIVGSIGGGCGEAGVRRAALEVMDSGQPRLVMVDLLDDPSVPDGAVCGGKMEVFVEPLLPDDPE